jgi:hypothetical protein
MNKKGTAIRVILKKNNEITFFNSCAKIFDKYTKEDIGILLPALWNAMSPSKGNGHYENKKCTVDRIQIKKWE